MAKKYTGWAYVSGSTGEGADGPVGAVQYRKDGASTDQTGSVNFVFSEGAAALFLTGTMHVDGTITSNNFDVVNHTVSYLSASGDSKFGDTAGDTHQFTGSVEVLGQISSSAEVSASAFWGDGSNLTGVGAAGVLTRVNGTQAYTTSSVAIGINRAPLGRLHLETNNATTCIFFEREHSSISLHDELGCLAFGGTLNGGTNYAPNAAVIRSIADGGWSNISTDTPAKLQFMTTPDGSNTVYTRMTIKGDGKVGIGDLDPSGTLHVQSARAVVSPHAYADDLIVETAGTAGGISVLNDDSNQNWIAMGHTSDNITSHWSDSYATKIASFGSDNIYYRTGITSGNGSYALVLDTAQNAHVLGNLTVTGSTIVSGNVAFPGNAISGSAGAVITMDGFNNVVFANYATVTQKLKLGGNALRDSNANDAITFDGIGNTQIGGTLILTGSLTRKDQARHLIYSTPGTGNFTATANAVNVFADGSWATPPTWASGSITANDIVFDQTTGRFTTSQATRLYAVSCTVVAEANSTAAEAELTATVNGSTVFKLGQIRLYQTTVTPMSLPMTFIVEMAASQYLEIFIDQVVSTHTVDVEYVNISIHAI